MSQTEIVYQILREGVQSAHTLVNGMLWAAGDSLKDMRENCTGPHEPMKKLLQHHQVRACACYLCVRQMYVCVCVR